MDIVTAICLFLLMFDIVQANANTKPWIYDHGDNATVLIEKVVTDGNKTLDIYFHGYANRLIYTHVMYYIPNTNLEKEQISRNYTGRILDIKMDSGNLSFILLNVKFTDSGNFTVFDGSKEKGKGNILVSRCKVSGAPYTRMVLLFMVNSTNISSVKISTSFVFDPANFLLIYDVERKNCLYTNRSQDFTKRNFSCVLNEANFILILKELLWSDKGIYTAWDDQGILLDSIYLNISDSSKSNKKNECGLNSSSSEEENGKSIWLWASSGVVVIVIAFLAIVPVRKRRLRELANATNNYPTDGNGSSNTGDIPHNSYQNFGTASSTEERVMILPKINNADDPTDFMYNRDQFKPAHEMQIQSRVSSVENIQSETAHGYKSNKKGMKMKTECRLNKPYLTSTKSITGKSFEYDHAVQSFCLTSSAQMQDTAVNKRIKGNFMNGDSIFWHRNKDTLSSTDDPSTLYAVVDKTRSKDIHCTDSRAEVEQRNRDHDRNLTVPRDLKLESAASKGQGASQWPNYELARDVSHD